MWSLLIGSTVVMEQHISSSPQRRTERPAGPVHGPGSGQMSIEAVSENMADLNTSNSSMKTLPKGIYSFPQQLSTGPREGLPGNDSLPGDQSRVPTETNREMGASASSGTQFGLKYPSSTWKFNHFLFELGKEISKDEAQKLKSLFTEIIGKRRLEKVETIDDLFKTMRETYGVLSENNFIYLQALLKTLKRPDLIHKTVAFASSARNVKYLQPESDTPVNGFKFIKFHVVLDKEYILPDLKELQLLVAEILLCPPEYVFVPGVELVDSVLVTLMVKAEFAETMDTVLEGKQLQQVFLKLNIDTIITGKATYTIGDLQKTPTSAKDNQLLIMYQQLADKTKQLQILEDRCEQLEQSCEQLNETCQQLEANYNQEKAIVRKIKRTDSQVSQMYTLAKHFKKEQSRSIPNRTTRKRFSFRSFFFSM